jgi:hypothetical protein
MKALFLFSGKLSEPATLAHEIPRPSVALTRSVRPYLHAIKVISLRGSISLWGTNKQVNSFTIRPFRRRRSKRAAQTHKSSLPAQKPVRWLH